LKGRIVAQRTERKKIYAALGLPFIAPELPRSRARKFGLPLDGTLARAGD